MCFILKLLKKNKIHPGSYSPNPEKKVNVINNNEYKVCSREVIVLERRNTLLN